MRTAGQGPGGFEKRDGHINPGQELIFAVLPVWQEPDASWKQKRK